MSLTTGEMSAADLAAVVGNNGNNGFGDMNGGWWLILLFLIFGNGWGNGFGILAICHGQESGSDMDGHG